MGAGASSLAVLEGGKTGLGGVGGAAGAAGKGGNVALPPRGGQGTARPAAQDRPITPCWRILEGFSAK